MGPAITRVLNQPILVYKEPHGLTYNSPAVAKLKNRSPARIT
jgi:hypothetical protein